MSDKITRIPQIRFEGFTDDWEQRKLGNIFEKVSNKVSVEKKTLYKQIGIRSHGKGIFYKDEVTGAQLGNKSVFWIEPNVFIVNIVFAWEQAIARTTENEKGMIASHRFPMYQPIAEILDLDYITMYFKTLRGKHLLESASPGGAGRNKTLGQKEFANLIVRLPSVEEQIKTGSFFKQLDDTIALHQREYDLLNETKQSYLQKMFPKKGDDKPEIRFAGFTEPWEQRKFGDTIKEKREKTKVEDEDVLLSSAIDGMYLNSELFSHFRGSSNIGYLKIKMNDMILSAQNLHLGNCNINRRFEHGIISPAYKVYSLVGTDPNFMNAWIKKDSTKIFFEKATTEGASVCRKNIDWGSLYKQTLAIPTIDEQQKIGEFFEGIDSTIALHHNQLNILKSMKQSLLQQMFV